MTWGERIGVIGTAMAVAISWSANESILWAAFHACFGWLYVLYYAIWG